MNIFKKQLEPVNRVHAAPIHKAVFITDSHKLAQQASKEGLEVIKLQVSELSQSAKRQQEIAQTLVKHEIIINAMGHEQEALNFTFEDAQLLASSYTTLLRIIKKIPQRFHLISLSASSHFWMAMMNGLADSLAQENSRLTYQAIQYQESLMLPLKEVIGNCLAHQPKHLLLKNGTFYNHTFLPLSSGSTTSTVQLKTGGTYIITGGSGGVGRELCKYLATKYKAQVFIVGRKALDQELANNLKTAGAKSYLKADVSELSSLQSAIKHVEAATRQIDGVFHLAGSLNDAMFDNMTTEQLYQTLQPKVAGTLNLARIDQETNLGFVCHFTSLSGLIGNFGQAAYASANAFVDAFVENYQQNKNSYWLSINWGLWQTEGGMQMQDADHLAPMHIEEAGKALEIALAHQRTVAFKGNPALLKQESASPATSSSQPASLKPSEQATEKWLKEIIFKYTRLKNFDSKASIIELGADSVALIHITTAIEKELRAFRTELKLNKAMLFDYPSVSELANMLNEQYPSEMLNLFGNAQSDNQNSPEAYPNSVEDEGPAPKEAVLEWLKVIVQKYSGLKNLKTTDNLLSLGIDSVTSINISTEISRQLSVNQKVNLPKAILFEYSSLEALTDYLFEEYSESLNQIVKKTQDEAPAPAVPSEDKTPPVSSFVQETFKPKKEAQQHSQHDSSYRPDDIAIVGLAGEFPEADNIEELWNMLIAAQHGITPVPLSRWEWQKDYTTNRKDSTKTYGRHGGFIRRAKEFDPVFFKIAPVDAERIDPQERRLLQMSYHALEDSGYFASPTQEVGVFVAAMFGHYQNLDHEKGALSNSFASIANRISYSFNFQGPSFTVDSMCSGSLTALHLAANSLKVQESKIAVVGAVNIMPHPGKYKMLSEGKFMSPTGRCHAFGIEADGYVPGEGTVSVVLKRVDQAIQDNDQIYGVIRSTALNSGGRSGGFTVPSAKAQAKVIKKALEKADISADAVDYIEAHGTGTSLGDPIEIQGLNSVYGNRTVSDPILVGSVKSNIGHLESAAGMAGLTKLVLQMRSSQIAPTLGCTLENPHLNLNQTPFALAKQKQDWSPSKIRYASLSSFGAGGSNAHLILQEYRKEQAIDLPKWEHYLIPLSAINNKALRQRVEDLYAFLSEKEADIYSVSYSLACTREHFSKRVCYQVSSVDDLKNILKNQLDRPEGIHSVIEQKSSLAHTAQKYISGEQVDFNSLYPVKSKCSLPYYPFERKEYWLDVTHQNVHKPEPAKSEKEDTDATVLFAPLWNEIASPAAKQEFSKDEICILFGENFSPLLTLGDCTKLHVLRGNQLQLDSSALIIRPEVQEDYTALFEYLKDTYNIKKVNFIYFAEAKEQLTQEAFHLGKAVVNSALEVKLLYMYAERSSTDANLLASALRGVYHVAALEKRSFQARALEVAPSLIASNAKLSQALLEEYAESWNEFQLIRRDIQKRQIRSLKESSLSHTSPRFKKAGVYIISGGMGMIGLAIAQRLIHKYEARVILLGRSVLDENKKNQLSKLNEGAGEATYYSVDITDAAKIRKCVQAVIAQHGHIHGIIHSAAVLKDSLLQNKSREDFEQVLNVKIAGTNNLHQATKELPLDFFTLFSSMSSIMGNTGQADYVSANCYLDHFAEERNEQVKKGLASGHTLSINWPLWIDDTEDSEDKMAEYTALSKYLFRTFGIKPFTIRQGCEFFFQLINQASEQTNQLVAFSGDPEKIRQKMAGDQLLPETAEDDQTTVSKTSGPSDVPALAKRMAELVSTITHLAVDEIDETISWGDMGFSSVMLQKLASEAGEIFDLSIPANIFFTYNSLEEFAEYLHEEGCMVDKEEETASKMEEKTPLPASDPTPEISKRNQASGKTDTDKKGYAIIGIAGQMPGGKNLEDYWQLLTHQKSAIQKVDRWKHKDYYAGTIPDIDHFDPKFFGLSAREAMLMDPQHRLFLQTSYNTFLDAGYSPKELTKVGVFAGIQFNDYQTLLQQWQQSSHPYAATGNAHTMLANRVSYLMNFRGPSQTIDTACSSALVALNRGVMSLKHGECDVALVGGVSLLIDPVISDAAESMGVLSPNYRCATFDAKADGYVRAEGVGCVLIKPLNQALEDGDNIYAVIDNCVENHGGKANSLTAPNPEAQKELLIRSYTPDTAEKVSYIETHGTGTKLGDPIEIDALKSAWKELCPQKPFHSIALGAVKTNIGHLEPAAGIASLLKVVLAFKHNYLPANLNFHDQNPYISLSESPFYLLSQAQEWEASEERVAGISSFGFGGSNAHAVLKQAPGKVHQPHHEKGHYLVTLSAKSLTSLKKMSQNLYHELCKETTEEYSLANLAFTLNKGRDHFNYRMAWIVSSLEELKQELMNCDFEQINNVRPSNAKAETPDLTPQDQDYTSQLEDWKAAYLSGKSLDWNRLHHDEACQRLHLPTYHFDTQSYWFEDAKDTKLIKEI